MQVGVGGCLLSLLEIVWKEVYRVSLETSLWLQRSEVVCMEDTDLFCKFLTNSSLISELMKLKSVAQTTNRDRLPSKQSCTFWNAFTTNAETHPIKKTCICLFGRFNTQISTKNTWAADSVRTGRFDICQDKTPGGPRGLKQDLLISNHKVQLPPSLNGPVSWHFFPEIKQQCLSSALKA